MVRAELERKLVLAEAAGFDIDKSYRDFLATNSSVCVRALKYADDFEGVAALVAGAEQVDLGCNNPVGHGQGVASVALDGETGVSYGPDSTGIPLVVVAIVSREAPPLDDVRDAVLARAVPTHGPQVFDRWAAGLLAAATVGIDPAIGTWEPSVNSGELPMVVPAG